MPMLLFSTASMVCAVIFAEGVVIAKTTASACR
jgi:hypothetical protein